MITISKERKNKIDRVAKTRQEGVIVLEDVHDPHNAEAVVRSCDAFGFQKVYLIFEKEKPYDPRVIGKSSSRGTNKWIDFKIFYSTQECIKELKKEGYFLIVTALTSKSAPIYKEKFIEKKLALAFGNEHTGVSDEMINMADRIICIPMKGMAQSLNISVCAAIFMYEVERQRKEQGAEKFLFSKSERLELKKKFLLKR